MKLSKRMGGAEQRERNVSLIAALPAYLWEIYFLFLPIVFILAYSIIIDNSASGGVGGSQAGILQSIKNGMLTLGHYQKLFTPVYLKILWNSTVLAVLTASITLVIAYPIAYYIALHAKKYKNLFIVFLILPSWTSFIIQIYSWFFVLQKGGILSSFLKNIGLVNYELNFLNSFGATLLGMVYCYLPFMVLPIYTVLERMDKRLLEASADLGANKFVTFWRVIFPLSLSGIKVGLFLVMIPAFGEFAIPDLMGGFKDIYLGRVVMEKFLLYRDWHSGAAVVMLSILFPLLLVSGIVLLRIIYRVINKSLSNTDDEDQHGEDDNFGSGNRLKDIYERTKNNSQLYHELGDLEDRLRGE